MLTKKLKPLGSLQKLETVTAGSSFMVKAILGGALGLVFLLISFATTFDVQAQTANPNPATFPNTVAGITSAAQPITFNPPITGSYLTSVTITPPGDFAIQSNTCPLGTTITVACTVNVTFTPQAVGTRTAMLSFVDALNSTTVNVPLSGTGLAPIVTVAPTALNFTSQLVNTTSPTANVTLSTNFFPAGTLAISSIAITGNSEFVIQAGGCPASGTINANCTISVNFTPTAAGTRPNGTLTITHNYGTTTVALQGTGLAPVVTVAPTSLTFAPQLLGTASAAQAVTLSTNFFPSNSLGISSTTISGNNEFSIQPGGCPASGAISASCTINIIFTPTVFGPRPIGTLTITHTYGTTNVNLLGTGNVAPTSIAPTSLTFAAQTVGTISAPQVATLTHAYLPAPGLAISAIAITGDFALSSTTCPNPGTLTGANCNAAVVFRPTAAGTRTGTLTISYSSPTSGSVSVNLTGIGAAQAVSPAPRSNSAIGGTVRLDGQPAPGFTVRLDPTGRSMVTGSDGRYNFTGLAVGTYKVRVMDYDANKVTPVNGDFSDQTVTGDSVETGIDFAFVSVAQATTSPTATLTDTVTPTIPTTTLPTATATATPVPITNATPTPTETPIATTPSTNPTATPIIVPVAAPQCPPPIRGQDLQIVVQTCTSSDPNVSYITISIFNDAEFAVDLSQTVVVNAPGSVLESLPDSGSVSVNGNNLSWSAGILQPGQTTNLLIGVNVPVGSIGTTLITVTGTFSTGEAFSRVISGLTPLTEVEPNVPTTPAPTRSGGTSGGNVGTPGTRPGSLPSTGQPVTPSTNALQLVLTIAVGGLWLAVFGLIFWRLLWPRLHNRR